jgi:ketosteroid isomerase-like protein
MTNVDTVKAIYEAFGRGDVPAILERLDEKVEWETETETPGVPWLAPRHGRANVAGFFEALAPLEITRFEPHTFLEGPGVVFAIIALEANVKGKHYVIPNEGHLWRFASDGKVTKYDHIVDTLTHSKMARGE